MKTRGFLGWLPGLRAGSVLVAWLSWWGAFAADQTPATPPAESTITLEAPKPGARLEAPGPVIIEAVAVDPDGDIRHLDFFANGKAIGSSDYLLKIATIPGRPIPHRLEWAGVEPGQYRIQAQGTDTRGRKVVSGAREIEVLRSSAEGRFNLVPAGAAWRYRYDGTNLGEDWRTLSYADEDWASGPAQLGFGDGDEKTVIRTAKAPHPITAYFRREFQVPADLNLTRLVVRLVRDDGAVVYLNGKEILRSNLPDGKVLAGTLAASSTGEENAVRSFVVAPTELVAGRNVLAVEVHQASAESSDLSFDLALDGVPRQTATEAARVSIEATRPATSEPTPTARIAPGQFTIRRTGSTDLPLVVFVKWDGTATPGKDYPALESPVLIPAGKAEVVLEVVANNDELVEGVETVVGTLVVPLDWVGPLALPGVALPGFVGALPLLDYVIDSTKASAEVTIRDADLPQKATLVIQAPKAESRFPEGTDITVRALAFDPAGYVTKVEFFAGEISIGVSDLQFFREPDPGTPIIHEIEWAKAPAGSHRLTARAVSSTGAKLVSEAVPIVVVGASDQVVLAVEATDATAAEPAAGDATDTGVVTVRRVSGRKDVALAVTYRLGGTAQNGSDYAKLSGRVELPRNRDSVEIAIRPLADRLLEGEEKVEVKLEDIACIEIFPPPPDCYRVSEKNAAVVSIRDRSTAPATLTLGSPKDGATFVEGSTIPIVATAVDPEGYISRVEFYAGERRIGVSELTFIRAPDPGTPIVHQFEWVGAGVGTHRMYARAVASGGATVVSPAVVVKVTAKPAETNDWLLNVNFGLWKEKKGPAATGLAATDYWNPWEFVYQPDVSVAGLKLADGQVSPVGMRVRNAGGSWNNATGDGMYDSYVYPNSGLGDGVGEIQVSLSRVPAGKYDLYLYGHADPGGRPESDSMFVVTVGVTKQVPKGTVASAGWKAEQGWKEGAQYVVFRGLEVAGGDPVEIVVQPGFDGEPVSGKPDQRVAVLNGLQLRTAGSGEATGRLVITQPKAGATLPSRTTTEVLVEAVDSKGGITRVELFDGEKLIGVSEILFIVPPTPGVPIHHSIVWKNPEPGNHVLVARAVDSAGVRVQSGRVPVTVGNDRPPRVAVTGPRSGSVFMTGETIVVEAEASDTDGTIERLDLYDGDRLLGSTKLATLVVEWKEATAGVHKLTARVVDNGGREAVSDPVTILVRDAVTLAFVRRELPPAYLPGGTVEVVLVAEPPHSGKAWTVEDQPPGGWKATAVSDDGVFDATRGRVKFGPFTDSKARRLTYELKAAPDRVGPQTFTGTSSLDGRTYPVAGESVLPPAGQQHPADRTPANLAIGADELTAYAAAWKTGAGWADDPSPIPLAYVTRAGQIWKQGETYVYDSAKGAPPACWVPAPPQGPGLASANAAKGSSAVSGGTAERQAPVVWRTGVPGEVRLSVAPPVGTFATGIEEIVPPGWRVASVGSDGQYDPAAGRIRWGLMFGSAAFEVRYQLVPPTDTASTVEWQGRASFDGATVPISGLRRAGASGDATILRIAGSHREDQGHLRFRVEAAAGQVFVVEASNDLGNWTEVGTFIHTGEELPVNDPGASDGPGNRYYRLRPVGP